MAFINTNRIAVISKSTCPFCRRVNSLFDNIRSEHGTPFAVMEINELAPNEMNEIQDHMKRITGGRSVPRVFIDGKFVGGCDDTMQLSRSGLLFEKIGIKSSA